MYIDLCGLFGLSQTSFYHPLHGPLWSIIHALDMVLADHVAFKTDYFSSCEKAAADFAHFSRGMLNRCVCAVDGVALPFLSLCYSMTFTIYQYTTLFILSSVVLVHVLFLLVVSAKICLCTVTNVGLVIRTRCPTPREMRAFAAPDLSSFINRKGYYGIVVMAACTANLEFVFFSAKHTGSTNDCIAIQGCEGGNIVLGKSAIQLPVGFYGVGDEAFICTETLLTPWSGRGLDRNKDSFNFLLSSMRQCIERAFGTFVARWGIFRRPLVFQG
jgi:hypothetical protein